jgi:hypothetical protein
MMDATHYWLFPAKLPICGRTSGYATTDARDVTCGTCQRQIRSGWAAANLERKLTRRPKKKGPSVSDG